MEYKYKLVFDVNGNDLGPLQCFLAVQDFVKKYKDTQVTLVGDVKDFLHLVIDNDAIQLIQNDLKPADPKNIRGSMSEKTAMNQAIQMIIDKEADGILSAGDSGLYISALTLKAKRLENVSRPAFMPVANKVNGEKLLFLDVGANIETKPEYLVEWAYLANCFYKTMFKNEPKVALLNIGTEDYKGLDFVKQAHSQLTNQNDLNYVGFRETRNLFKDDYNIAVIDGYAGNIMLKSYEGAVMTFTGALKETIYSKFLYKLGAFLLKGAFKKVASTLDYRSVGCAWVLGVNALALKAHGSSDHVSYFNALVSLREAVSKNVLEQLKTSLVKQVVEQADE
ncbi:phosphate acyltransferase PlsX [Mycoplasma nasistruthionis]|uniref:Phosphate acyltransferase n=1 Tax=Mycoplasma nasistruthionis TaxID=353852 RepID=A0A4Y6I5Z0_9MOLU|nr:phosphate acyltransferase PlsX [Mycoplasma nasistruthionis]QCZ36753.1 phosphate acyltransferase PlsX [Mycoplasma nasistruthionis]QDF65036.1 phosphate acyltransferase PlsX [Mycoplasma nasistruthionis]